MASYVAARDSETDARVEWPGKDWLPAMSKLPGTRWSDQAIRQAVAPMRVGRSLKPLHWPDGARVAVCLSWDLDNETSRLAHGEVSPVALSWGEYGAVQALPRILAVYDRYGLPGSFFVPGAVGLLYPELVEAFRTRPQHEIGVHGWIHENPELLDDREEEARLLNRAIQFWSDALGKRPMGYRAPHWAFSAHTLALIREAGFLYDSSAMGMDDPYELMADGKPTGLVELPVDLALDDAPYLWMPGGAMPSAELAFTVFREEFDQAHAEGGLFMLTLHPMVAGRRSRIVHFERLIDHIRAKPGVWIATARDIAAYVRTAGGL